MATLKHLYSDCLELISYFLSVAGDENDNSPVFTVAQQSVTLQEQTQVPSQPFPLIGAVDSDSKDNRFDQKADTSEHSPIYEIYNILYTMGIGCL